MSSFSKPSESKAHVLAAAAAGVEDFLTSQGGDMERIAGRSGLSTRQFALPTDALNLAAYCRLFAEAEIETRNGNIGLCFGQQFKPHQLGLIGYIALCSETVEQAVRNLAAYFGYHQASTVTCLTETAETFQLDYMITDPTIQHRRHDAELTMGMFANILRTGLGPAWTPQAVLFAHDQPEQAGEHRDAFQSDVRFAVGRNALIFRRDRLETRMPGADAGLLQIMKSSLVTLARGPENAKSEQAPSLRQQVIMQIRACLPHGGCEFWEIAEKLALSPWTLQRRLGQLGLSYSALLDEVRQIDAIRLLTEANRDISEIAILLGYTETSAFSRAFRRWFGMSPRVWQQQNNGRPSR